MPLASIRHFDNAEDYQAKPEIHHQAQVQSWSYMPGRRGQVRHDQKINRVSSQNRDQGVHEIAH